MSYHFMPNVEQLEAREVVSSLLDRALAERPQIATATNDFQAVNQIREWAYSQIDNSTIGYGQTLDFHGMTAQQMLDVFDGDLAGVNCGGAAYFLRAIYNEFGFDAATVGGGDGTFSHVVTLVKLESPDGLPLHSVQDPLSNSTYTDSAGNPLHFSRIVDMLDNDRDDEIILREGESVGRDALANEDLHKQYLQNNHDLLYDPEKIGEDRYVWQSNLTASWLVDNWHPNPISLFSNIVNPENWRYAEAEPEETTDPIDHVFSAYTVNGGPRVIVERDGDPHRDFWAYSPAVAAANAVVHDDWVWTSAPTGDGRFHVKAFDVDTTTVQRNYYV